MSIDTTHHILLHHKDNLAFLYHILRIQESYNFMHSNSYNFMHSIFFSLEKSPSDFFLDHSDWVIVYFFTFLVAIQHLIHSCLFMSCHSFLQSNNNKKSVLVHLICSSQFHLIFLFSYFLLSYDKFTKMLAFFSRISLILPLIYTQYCSMCVWCAFYLNLIIRCIRCIVDNDRSDHFTCTTVFFVRSK